jgi:flagellar hook assembly protein FlgD
MKEAVSISYQIPRESRSRLAVYDITGRLVCQTPSIVAAPGKNHFTWNGRDARGCPVGNGIYIFRVEAEGRFGTARTALIR